MHSTDVRQSFLDFFEERGHLLVPSAPLVPQDDPTLLFVNAGMVPFKDYFLGAQEPQSQRVASSQKCLRVSGKHNDLENVGPSPRHHTFFEMLGNFSFGDYFKAEAIEFGWDLVTRVWGINPDHLFATVFEEDDEAAELWQKLTPLPAERIPRCGRKDNFWAMGDVGPCGPCSEIHIDRYPDRPQVPWDEGSESGRYFEVWNLVFMQFEAGEDGSLEPLPNPSIDTGAGLERVSSLLQEVESNYDLDLFKPLIEHTAELCSWRYGDDLAADTSMRVIADHVRAVAFLLTDGVIPSNEGRGYVLRRILRRASRHGMRLGLEEPFIHRLLPTLEDAMPYRRELGAAREASAATIESEEGKFLGTVAAAAERVQSTIETLKEQGRSTLDGESVFRFYDTYGLPPEMVAEIAEEEGFSVDRDGFEKALEEQRSRSRSTGSRAGEELASLRRALALKDAPLATDFVGYRELRLENARVVRLARRDSEGGYEATESLVAGDDGVVVLDRTVFYPEGGGQVGDIGTLRAEGASASVTDTVRDSGAILHHVRLDEGSVAAGDRLSLRSADARRRRTERNHTATHLLQASLRERLGTSVRQAGSLVHPDRLRFDFTFDRPLDDDDRQAIEDRIVEWIRKALPTEISQRSYDEAIEAGAMALFGEKYGDRVRTVEVPGFSLELCGGCHVANTGEIGGFRITSERGVASGVRRIEAVTGDAADSLARRDQRHLAAVESQLGVPIDSAVNEIAALSNQLREAEKELRKLRMASLGGGDAAVVEEVEVDGIKVLSKEITGTPSSELREMADVLRQRLGSGVVVLGARSDNKVNLVVAVSEDVQSRVDAGRLAREMGSLVGGNGGGRADFAQAGGKDPSRLPEALGAVPSVVEDQLSAAAP